MRKTTRLGALLLGAAVAFALVLPLRTTVSAAGTYSSSGKEDGGHARVEIQYHPEDFSNQKTDPDTPLDILKKQGYWLYMVANWDESTGHFVLTKDFAELQGTTIPTKMTLQNLYADENKNDLASAVSRAGAYILAHPNLVPSYTAPIEKGVSLFTDLPDGLYLVAGSATVFTSSGGSTKTATPDSFLLCIPYVTTDPTTGATTSHTDITAVAKFQYSYYTPTGGGGGGGRTPTPPPTPTTPDTPTPPDNPDTPPDNPPDNPPVDIPDEPPPLIDIPDEPVPQTDIPDEPTPLIEIPDTDVPKKPNLPVTTIPDKDVPRARLPQTGLLWWPVPVMGSGGAVLMGLGIRGWRKSK